MTTWIEKALEKARAALDDLEEVMNTHKQELEAIIDDLQKERDEALRRIDTLEEENASIRWELMEDDSGFC